MNCCWAATAALESMELLTASAVGVEAAGPANPRSFPKAIMAGMKLLGDEAFTVASLHAVLMKFCNKLMSTPIYVQKENAEDGPIILPKFTSDVIKLPGYMDGLSKMMEQRSAEPQTFVLVKIRLSTKAPSPKEFYDYLRSKLPSCVESIEVAATFEGSNILLLKIPMILWSNLRDNPAYGFVDYVKSGNQLVPVRTQNQWKIL